MSLVLAVGVSASANVPSPAYKVSVNPTVEGRMVTTRQTVQRPPLSKTTDEDVIAFVAGTEGAVGYVSLATAVPDTVRDVSVH